MSDIVFHYQYRDADNWKQHNAINFPDPDGLGLEAAERRLRAAFDDGGEYFIASQIRVPEQFLSGEGTADHCWHEFESLEQLREVGLINVERDAHGRTLLQFVEEVERANAEGWQEFFRGTSEELLDVVADIAATLLPPDLKAEFVARVRDKTKLGL